MTKTSEQYGVVLPTTPTSDWTAIGSGYYQYTTCPAVPDSSAVATITQDADYYYVKFTASGVLRALKAFTADVLVVGGGGGTMDATNGGGGTSGGGGGGVATGTFSFSIGTTVVTIGAGGVKDTGGTSRLGALLTANGGTYGQRWAGGYYGSGGSGAPTAHSGANVGSSQTGGSGGAGAGANGIGAGSGGVGANGANGIQWLNGSYYGGGGAGAGYNASGGTGGLGGGANGGTNNTAGGYSGTPNTGGGAGGGNGVTNPTSFPGATGGSGVVILRIAK